MNEPETMDLFGEKEAEEKQQKSGVKSNSDILELQTNQKKKQAQKQSRSVSPDSSRKKGPKKSEGAMRTISEVASSLEVEQHVLRFWETKFHQIKPLKRGGGRRYYRPRDVEIVSCIHHFLHVEGYTIKGLQRLLRKLSLDDFLALNKQSTTQPVSPVQKGTITKEPQETQHIHKTDKKLLQDILNNLNTIRKELAS